MVPNLEYSIGQSNDLWTPRFGAVVDSGSPWCLFPTAWADFLGIKVIDGVESVIGGILKGDTEPIYFHDVRIQVENNWNIAVRAGFTKRLAVAGILGRNGFFDNFFVRFDHSTKPPRFEIERIPIIQ